METAQLEGLPCTAVQEYLAPQALCLSMSEMRQPYAIGIVLTLTKRHETELCEELLSRLEVIYIKRTEHPHRDFLFSQDNLNFI